jgi:dephospho-CoA kinase|tara:strand:- start:442 stop:1017 length:576 start_codon:yes stop_codon:yes gene_type:complete
MIRVAILGDIGSGKTFVSKQFGYPIFNADNEVSKIYNQDKSCFLKIKKALPKFILSNSLKKNELTNAILNDFKNLKKISNVVHPLVRKKLNNFLIKNKKKKLVILDIPLFIENKLNKKNDILVYIEAKKTDIQKKLKKRKNSNKKILQNLRRIQLPLSKKKKISNFIIINNFRIKSVQKDIIIIKKKILNK